MRDEPIDVLGKWWLPETPEHKVTGILTFTEDEGAQLLLSDALRADDEVVWDEKSPDGAKVGHVTRRSLQHAGTYSRIVGRADNVPYTLEDCFRTRLRGRTGFGDAAETVHVNAILRGIELEPGEALECTSASVALTQLTSWSGVNGLRVDHARYKPGSTEERRPYVTVNADLVPAVTVPFDGGTLKLAQHLATNPQVPNAVTVTQSTRVMVTFDEGSARPLEDFITRMNDVQDLVTIATGTTAAKYDFQLSHPGARYPVDYFVRWNNRATKDEHVPSVWMLFTLEDLTVDGLASWLRTATTFQSELRRITATKYQTSMFVEDRASNIMAALESITRHPHKKSPNYFIDDLKDCIYEVGEPFLRLIEGDVDTWAQLAKSRRNDLAHHNAGVLEMSSSSVQLTREMYWLAVLLLLRRANAPDAVFDKIGRSSEFTFLAEQHAAQSSSEVQ